MALGLMKRHARFWAGLIFCAVGLLTFFVGVSCASWVGLMTDSGMFGICGPYGQHPGLVASVFLASFPAAIAAGYFSARFFYRRVRDEHKA